MFKPHSKKLAIKTPKECPPQQCGGTDTLRGKQAVKKSLPCTEITTVH